LLVNIISCNRVYITYILVDILTLQTRKPFIHIQTCQPWSFL